MRIFIAGATGVLGRQLVRQLRARGHDVIGLARRIGARRPRTGIGIPSGARQPE